MAHFLQTIQMPLTRGSSRIFFSPEERKTPVAGGFALQVFYLLLSNGRMQGVIFCFEELLRELCRNFRVVVLAREDVQVHVRICRVPEVSRDKGCFDELGHRISRYPWIFAEINHDTLAETFHFDEVAELYYELLNLFRRPDGLRIASVEVDPRMQTPGVDELILFSYRYIGL